MQDQGEQVIEQPAYRRGGRHGGLRRRLHGWLDRQPAAPACGPRAGPPARAAAGAAIAASKAGAYAARPGTKYSHDRARLRQIYRNFTCRRLSSRPHLVWALASSFTNARPVHEAPAPTYASGLSRTRLKFWFPSQSPTP
jgi:hypothetical protein